MNNFVFQNPTKLIFGKGSISQIETEIPQNAKIMLTYGGGSIKKNGVYDQVMTALKGRKVIEFSGIEANPDYDTLMRAVDICRAEHVDFLLAVGGGSVIDGTKFIATAINYNSEPWEFLLDQQKAGPATPLATVLTLPATGSEMNNGAVISRRAIGEKLAFHNPNCYPQFSILDPQVCYSLPDKQIINGVIDTFAHILEQYLTKTDESMVMDRWAEGLMLTLLEIAPKMLANRQDYDLASNFMLSATMGLNGFISMGITQDWATHMIGHELTALHGLDHGLTLAIVYPGVMHVMAAQKQEKLLLYAQRVWNLTPNQTNNPLSTSQCIDQAIANTETFFRSLGVKTRLSEHNIGLDTINTIVDRFTKRGWNIGENNIVSPKHVREILLRVM